ncbi:E3 ubiquitin/ISG15 ligase TRIM25-like [Gastrophryne carolinensis]
MASAAFTEELNCSICLGYYRDPVSLKCQHSFCRECIEIVLDAQKPSGIYTCPECREEYLERPLLEINRKLRNIVEGFQSTHKEVSCTYCVEAPVCAVRTCLHCDISLCAVHLEAHNKVLDHVLVEPTSTPMNKKCAIHKKPLEFYCPVDDTCLCTSCCLVGQHRGHEVVLPEEAAEQKKEKLKNLLEKMMPKKEKIEKQVQNLHNHKEKVQENASKEKQRATNLFRGIGKQLEIQEKKALSEISKHEEQALGSASNLIKELETQKNELSTKISVTEKLKSIDDPITLLQEKLPDIDDTCDPQDEKENKVPLTLDIPLISLSIHKSITDFIKDVNAMVGNHIKEASDILLDTNTAHMNVILSPDLKAASFSATPQEKPEMLGRFKHWSQVLSSKSFNGQHFWEIETSDSGVCEVGVCYPSMGRQGDGSSFGDNPMSWSLRLTGRKYLAIHNSRQQHLALKSACRRFGVFLDYGSGHVSFYQLCDPVQHIHTFSMAFTEPLHAAFGVNDGAWVRIRG